MVYTNEELLKRAVKYAKPRSATRVPKWAAVIDVFHTGSGVAQELCRRFGVDPDVMVEGVQCEVCAEREEE